MGKDDGPETILKTIEPQGTIYLATLEKGAPRVRPVTMIHYQDGYYVLTGMGDAKIQQIREDGRVEICIPREDGNGSGYLRILGDMDIVTDKALKKAVSERADYFKVYWKGADDPDYALLKFKMKGLEFMRPGGSSCKRYAL